MSERDHLEAEEQGRREMRSFWERTATGREALARQTRDAVDDIRIKLVEEGWTGRSETDRARRWAEPEYRGPEAETREPSSFEAEQRALYGDDGRRGAPGRTEKAEPEKDGPER